MTRAPRTGVAFVALVLVVLDLTAKISVVAASEPHNTVQHLTSDNFEDALSDPANGFWFLKFYAPWCGHCKRMAPTLDEVAPKVAGRMAIGKIDCTKESGLCSNFDVKGYPTIKIFRDGEYSPYNGGRDAKAILRFANRMSRHAISAVVGTLSEALDKVASKSSSRVAFIAFDPNAKIDDSLSSVAWSDATDEQVQSLVHTSETYQVFGQVARKLQASADFGIIAPGTSMDEISKFGIDGTHSIVIKIEQDINPVRFVDSMTSPNLADFVKANNQALVSPLGPHNFHSVSNDGKRLVLAATDDENAAASESIIGDLKTFAKSASKEILAQYNFGYLNGKKWSGFVKQFNITTTPDLAVVDMPKKVYWKDDENENAADAGAKPNVADLIQKIEQGVIRARSFEGKTSRGIMKRIEHEFTSRLPYSLIALLGFIFLIMFFIMDGGPDEVEPPSNNAETDATTRKEEKESKKDQ